MLQNILLYSVFQNIIFYCVFQNIIFYSMFQNILLYCVFQNIIFYSVFQNIIFYSMFQNILLYIYFSQEYSVVENILFNAGTASSKLCLWPITDTECQVWAHILRSTFWNFSCDECISFLNLKKNCVRSFIFSKNPVPFS